MIPKHKCSALCREEEGIHVIPATTDDGRDLNFWKSLYSEFEVIESRREDDAVGEVMKYVQSSIDEMWQLPTTPSLHVGYLLTVRDKEVP